MIITNLIANNVKVLKAINITPDGSMVVVGGDNGQGKSSTLDSIMYALLGGRKICSTPVRTGQSEAEIIVEIGDLVVTKKLRPSGDHYLTITDKGKKVTSPQALLDSLTGALSFDPLAFAGMNPKDQLNMLKDLVGVDLSSLDSDRKKCFDDRTVIGRIRDQYSATLSSLAVPTTTTTEKIDVQVLFKEIADANLFNNRIEDADKRRAVLADEIDRLDKEIIRLSEAKARYEEELATRSDIQSKIDVDALTVVLNKAMETNNDIDKNKQYNDTATLVASKTTEYNKLTERIKEIDTEKETLMSSAKFPIDGLSFGDDGVLFNGTPFDQASSAEKLKTSVAIGLAMNPELKVLLLRDGSLLDTDSLAMVAQMAEQNDAQVWIERVGKGDEVSVVIEDGLIVEDRTGISKPVTETEKKPKTRKKKTDVIVIEEDTVISDLVSTEDTIIDVIDDTPEEDTTREIIVDNVQSFDEADEAVQRAEMMINDVLGEYLEDTIDEIKVVAEKDTVHNSYEIGGNKIEETITETDGNINVEREVTFGDTQEIVVVKEPIVVNSKPEEIVVVCDGSDFIAIKKEPEPRKIVMPETDGIAIVNVPNGKRSVIDDDIDYDNIY